MKAALEGIGCRESINNYFQAKRESGRQWVASSTAATVYGLPSVD